MSGEFEFNPEKKRLSFEDGMKDAAGHLFRSAYDTAIAYFNSGEARWAAHHNGLLTMNKCDSKTIEAYAEV